MCTIPHPLDAEGNSIVVVAARLVLELVSGVSGRCYSILRFILRAAKPLD
jgi:hypothetical protein